MNKLNEYDIQFLIETLQKGESIPEDYKYKLFPVKQKEYELVYAGKMRKEDILANEDGVFPVPLQVEKVFNGEDYPTGKNDWRNMIVFGDNLQFLKTVYENKDSLIKDKVKGKIKLIYIDPPFGTGDEYDANRGQRAYTARAKGAEFVEFLRRRLILAREILADAGSIFVRIDFRFGHYLKIVLDGVFGKENFKNEIIVNRTGRPTETIKQYHTTHDVLYFYSKSSEYYFKNVTILRENPKWRAMHLPGVRWTEVPQQYLNLYSKKNLIEKKGKIVTRARIILGKELLPPEGRHWASSQEAILKAEKEGKIKWGGNNNPLAIEGEEKRIGDNWCDIPGYSQYYDYPTENAEELLRRVIETSTQKGDLILDFFAGSGTTAAVAEKLGRRWIVCDIGKLAFYTMQKRILTIENSKDLENPKKEYGKKASSFVTINTGLYNLKKIFELKKDDYINFVMNLFEVETIDKKVAGIKIDGQKKDGYYVLVYPYWQFRNASVDEEYLQDLHSHIGSKIGERLYIIAPANYVDFISDYHEIGKVRYYFLKVPYQIIKELHKVQFKKFRQPQSKRNVNDLDDAIGFHFIRQPEVESRFIKNSKNTELQITKFLSNYLEEDTGMDLGNFESLAMVLIDKDYDGKGFVMDEFHFAEDLLPKRNDEETEDEIKKELRHLKNITIPLNKEECGDKVMVVYIDIYGNEFKEVLNLRKR